jgi:hypothetical protein
LLGAPAAVAVVGLDLRDETQVHTLGLQRRRVRDVRWRDEDDTAPLPGQRGQGWHQQAEFAEAVLREQDFRQRTQRPAAAGQQAVEFRAAGGLGAQHGRRRGGAAPDARMPQDFIQADR